MEAKNNQIIQMMQERENSGASEAAGASSSTKKKQPDSSSIVGDAVELKGMLMKARAEAAELKQQLQISEHRGS